MRTGETAPLPKPPPMTSPTLADLLHHGYTEFAQWVHPMMAARAALSGEPVRLVAVHEDGRLQTADGRLVHDFLSGYGTQALGHRNPHIACALRSYLDHDAPSFFPSGISPFAGRLARRLAERTGYASVSLASSGTEAVEAAIKLARAATSRPRVLGLAGAYHGCTLGSLSLMEVGSMRDPFGPHLPGVESLPVGDLPALQAALAPRDVAAVLVEPIQVEAGMRPLPRAYLDGLLHHCEQHGTLLIADEVQTGLLRTGPFLASARWSRPPDVVVLAKALGGGLLPLSATLTQPAIFARAYGTLRTAESHHYTFAGNALCCVAGLAALDLFTDELSAHVQAAGAALQQALKAQLQPCPLVTDLRGQGLLWGIELAALDHPWLSFDGLGLPELSGEPALGLVFCQRLFRRGYLTHVTGHNWRVVRIQPPLATSIAQLETFVAVCQEELAALCQLV